MRTVYEPSQAEFSRLAHMAARRLVYAPLFSVAPELIEYEDVRVQTGLRGEIFDGELGIDVIVRPDFSTAQGAMRHPATQLQSRLHFYVQERFRRTSYKHFADVTFTEFNHASRQPSELYKIAAGLMIYGLYDHARDGFIKAYAIDVSRVLLAIQRGQLRFQKKMNKKRQSFVCIKLEELHGCNCLLWQLKREDCLQDAPPPVRSADRRELEVPGEDIADPFGDGKLTDWYDDEYRRLPEW